MPVQNSNRQHAKQNISNTTVPWEAQQDLCNYALKIIKGMQKLIELLYL